MKDHRPKVASTVANVTAKLRGIEDKGIIVRVFKTDKETYVAVHMANVGHIHMDWRGLPINGPEHAKLGPATAYAQHAANEIQRKKLGDAFHPMQGAIN